MFKNRSFYGSDFSKIYDNVLREIVSDAYLQPLSMQ